MSKESSRRLMEIAQELNTDDDPRVRALAMSVISQFEPDPSASGAYNLQTHPERSEDFWRGFWAGIWQCPK